MHWESAIPMCLKEVRLLLDLRLLQSKIARPRLQDLGRWKDFQCWTA